MPSPAAARASGTANHPPNKKNPRQPRLEDETNRKNHPAKRVGVVKVAAAARVAVKVAVEARVKVNGARVEANKAVVRRNVPMMTMTNS